MAWWPPGESVRWREFYFQYWIFVTNPADVMNRQSRTNNGRGILINWPSRCPLIWNYECAQPSPGFMIGDSVIVWHFEKSFSLSDIQNIVGGQQRPALVCGSDGQICGRNNPRLETARAKQTVVSLKTKKNLDQLTKFQTKLLKFLKPFSRKHKVIQSKK